VSTVGLLTGVAVGGLPRHDIILTGVTLIFVEAFSMGVGSYLSEYTTEESYLKESEAFKDSLVSSIIMFVSYAVVGLIPLLPFLLLTQNSLATLWSVIITLASLFVLGMISSKLLHLKVFRISVRMVILGGIAIAIGMLIGKLSGN
jgi:predicted membrane protein (TIGR00267 family)